MVTTKQAILWGIVCVAFTVCFLCIGALSREINVLTDSQKGVVGVTQSLVNLQSYEVAVLQAVGDDYPPKMSLGERSWCLNRSCLPKEN